MARKSGLGTLLSFDLERTWPTPLFQQLYRQLRQAVLEGRVRPGVRLPATRFLARELGVSRNTVLTAYEQLASEGFLELRHRSGVFVAEDLPIAEAIAVMNPPTPAPRIGKRGTAAIGARPIVDPRVEAAREAGRWPGCFASALPDVASFPFDLWARLLARSWRRPAAQLPVGGDAGGHSDLRAAIAHYVGEARGIACDSEHVLVVSGIRQALDLTCRLLLDPGDAAWMEEPGYWGVRAALAAAGAEVIPVPVDAEGLCVRLGLERSSGARVACVAPSHQLPLGVTMSAGRRLELLEWAHRSAGSILEDDYDSEFRYSGRPLEALQGLDRAGRVIYVGTFSKTLFPSLRLGFLVIPPDLRDVILAARRASDIHPPVPQQTILADLMIGGHFERHLRRMRTEYQTRLDALTEATTRYCGTSAHLRPVTTGLHAVLDLHDLDERDVTREAFARGVEVMPLSAYHFAPRGRATNALVLGFAAVPPDRINSAMERLAAAIDTVRKTTRRAR